ncbi:MAG: hypothetical protein HY703_02625 [Gemmatimonadetes bacterium]|nr:hypothetical protein [Gemmatimonadota bacterium]
MGTIRDSSRSRRRASALLLLQLALLLSYPGAAGAQYFGRNKVQYQDFDWRVLHADHFDIHFYPEEATAVGDAARMAERWYDRLSRVFQHEFRRKPVILYADHADFQQTNVIPGLIGEATGGVTEALKNRVVLPFTGAQCRQRGLRSLAIVNSQQEKV